jgi:hypothetical protein
VRRDEDRVRVEPLDGLRQPVRNVRPAEIRKGNAGPAWSGGVVGGMVGRGDHAEPVAARLEHGRSAGLAEISARADPLDPSRLEVCEGIEEGVRPEVERVVVREGHAVDAEAA